MRLFIVLVLFFGISLTSCKKYKLKQPAYLSLHWNFFNEDPAVSKIDITGGYFYLDRLEVHGVREEGPDVEIEQGILPEKISFDGGGSLGLSIDVPVGNYTNFNMDLSVVNDTKPSMTLYALFDKGEIQIPVRVEWSTKKIMSFSPGQTFELNKKNNYDMTLGIDAAVILAGITPHDWSEAGIAMENGVPTIVVTENVNHDIFFKIDQNLTQALKLEIK